MALPNDKELTLLGKFRAMLSDLELTEEERSDMFLVAWLRARDLDLKKANEMLRKSLEWRKEHDIARILDWTPPAKFRSEYYFEITGRDADGCPVLIIPFGKWDVRQAVEGGHRENWLRHIDYIIGLLFDDMRKTSKQIGRPVTQTVIIFQFEGFGMRQLTSLSNLNTILEFVRRFESNYPECLRAVYVVNATRLFTLLFRCVKPLLSARTLGKVEIYGTNQAQWKEVLRNNIPPDEYPVELGGAKTGYGGGSMKKMADDTDGNIDADGVEWTRIIVRPGEKVSVDITIEDPEMGSVLSWRFKTLDYDIGFLVLRNGADCYGKEQVWPYQRTDSHLRVQHDCIRCEKPGKYSLVFDNSHSRFREKQLYYCTNLTEPDS